MLGSVVSFPFIFLGPRYSSFDAFEGSLGANAVLHKRRNVATNIKLAEVKHVGSDSVTFAVFYRLDPPA